MQKTNYETLGRKLTKLYPHIAQQLSPIKPIFSDICIIKEIWERLCNEKYEYSSRAIFIGVVLNLYDPEVLAGFKLKLKTGIRSELAFILNSKETIISHNIRTVKNYYEIYSDFKKTVDSISTQITENVR